MKARPAREGPFCSECRAVGSIVLLGGPWRSMEDDQFLPIDMLTADNFYEVVACLEVALLQLDMGLVKTLISFWEVCWRR
ncbi:hypothetical protein ACQ86N_33025 [Puia sp. P3]|uniref:hypothetical protein n=1 Tax=Puia sp. P3 TaxID=3423952 RepID=UPI003D67106B